MNDVAGYLRPAINGRAKKAKPTEGAEFTYVRGYKMPIPYLAPRSRDKRTEPDP
jgi:hypothetical protein